MISGFIVKKGKMSSIFSPEGKITPTTLCFASPLTVTQTKTDAKDNYTAVQVSYGHRKHLHRPIQKKLTKQKIKASPFGFKEFKLTTDKPLQPGDQIAIDQVFSPWDKVKIIGISKGRGFAGVIKRHGFHRQPVTRGQSDRTRAPGAIGAQTPGRVLKGKKMPGHYGVAQITITSRVLTVDQQAQTITLAGPLPGASNSYLSLFKIS